MKKERLIEKIKGIEVGYHYEETYTELYNIAIDYMNETQDFSIEYLFEDYVDYDTAEMLAKEELERGGLARLQYFLGGISIYGRDIFRIDGYGNLCNVDINDIECLKSDLIDALEVE